MAEASFQQGQVCMAAASVSVAGGGQVSAAAVSVQTNRTAMSFVQASTVFQPVQANVQQSTLPTQVIVGQAQGVPLGTQNTSGMQANVVSFASGNRGYCSDSAKNPFRVVKTYCKVQTRVSSGTSLDDLFRAFEEDAPPTERRFVFFLASPSDYRSSQYSPDIFQALLDKAKENKTSGKSATAKRMYQKYADAPQWLKDLADIYATAQAGLARMKTENTNQEKQNQKTVFFVFKSDENPTESFDKAYEEAFIEFMATHLMALISGD